MPTHQTAHAVETLENGDWSPTPVHEFLGEVEEPAHVDDTFVCSSPCPDQDAFEVKLADLQPPQAGGGTLAVRLRKQGEGQVAVQVELREGGNVIASDTFEPTASFDDYEIEFSEQDLATINDWSDLRVRVTADVVSSPDCPSTSGSSSS
jgi:hypothetical protein